MTTSIGISPLSGPAAEPPSAAPATLGSELHVWTAVVGTDEPRAWLTADERAQRDLFRQAADRARFTAGRALLRRVLAHYIGCLPHAITFAADVYGKRHMEDSGAPHFNLAHAGAHVACAVALSPCGIDLEHVRDLPEAEAIARRLLSHDDYAAWSALEATERRDAWFAYWTLYEAWTKAEGRGVAAGVQPVAWDSARDGPEWVGTRWRPTDNYWLAAVTRHSPRGGLRVRWFDHLDLNGALEMD